MVTLQRLLEVVVCALEKKKPTDIVDLGDKEIF